MQTLVPGDIPNRPQGNVSKLANTLCNDVAHREDLLTLIIQQQMIVAEVRTSHVPMKIFSFHIEREGVGDDLVERFGVVVI